MEIIRHFEGIHVKKIENKKLIYEGGCLSVDSIIFATGYSPVLAPVHQISAKVDKKTRFPSVSLINESKNIPNLFFGGPLAYHGPGSLFIHGFIKHIPDTLREIKARIHS